VLAQCLSPAVAIALISDPTIDHFSVSVDSADDFAAFISLYETGFADISEDHLALCVSISRLLGNSSLMERFSALHSIPDQFTPATAISEPIFYESCASIPLPLFEYVRQHF
jgi:hypothetical protein